MIGSGSVSRIPTVNSRPAIRGSIMYDRNPAFPASPARTCSARIFSRAARHSASLLTTYSPIVDPSCTGLMITG